MRHAVRGAFLSGLVYPGAGQIALKRYGRGIAFALAVTVGLIALLVRIVQDGLAVIDGCESADSLFDISLLPQTALGVFGLRELLVILGLLAAVILLWAMSALDAYVIGRRMDAADLNSGES